MISDICDAVVPEAIPKYKILSPSFIGTFPIFFL